MWVHPEIRIWMKVLSFNQPGRELSDKINVERIFKLLSPTTDVKRI